MPFTVSISSTGGREDEREMRGEENVRIEATEFEREQETQKRKNHRKSLKIIEENIKKSPAIYMNKEKEKFNLKNSNIARLFYIEFLKSD